MKTYGKLYFFLFIMITMVVFVGILAFVSLFSAIDTVKVMTWSSSILGLLFVAFTGLMAERSTEVKQ